VDGVDHAVLDLELGESVVHFLKCFCNMISTLRVNFDPILCSFAPGMNLVPRDKHQPTLLD
jgi:hypothetical protein